LIQVKGKKKKRISKPEKSKKSFHFERPNKLSEGIKQTFFSGAFPAGAFPAVVGFFSAAFGGIFEVGLKSLVF